MALPVLLVSFMISALGWVLFRFSVHYNHPSVRKLWLRRFSEVKGGDAGLRGVIWVFFFTAVRVEKSKRLRFCLIILQMVPGNI